MDQIISASASVAPSRQKAEHTRETSEDASQDSKEQTPFESIFAEPEAQNAKQSATQRIGDTETEPPALVSTDATTEEALLVSDEEAVDPLKTDAETEFQPKAETRGSDRAARDAMEPIPRSDLASDRIDRGTQERSGLGEDVGVQGKLAANDGHKIQADGLRVPDPLNPKAIRQDSAALPGQTAILADGQTDAPDAPVAPTPAPSAEARAPKHMLEQALASVAAKPAVQSKTTDAAPDPELAQTAPKVTALTSDISSVLPPNTAKETMNGVVQAPVNAPPVSGERIVLPGGRIVSEADIEVSDRRPAIAPDISQVALDTTARTPTGTAQPVWQVAQMRMSQAQTGMDVAFQLKGEVEEVVPWDLRGSQAPGIQTSAVAQVPRADLPPQVAQQLAVAMHKAPDKPVEIALNPPELGRVRMIMSASDSGVVVQVLAERSDTLDLMRRNIDDLGRALNDLGYEDISFAFGQGDGDASDTADDKGSGDTSTLMTDDDAPQMVPAATPNRLAIAPDGIDIRF